MFKNIETHDKFYAIILLDGTHRTVRRDVYWDSGIKSSEETDLIAQIEAQLEDGWQV